MNKSSTEEWEEKFRQEGRRAPKKLGDYFIKEANLEEKINLVDFLLSSASNKFSQGNILPCAIHILRGYSQTTDASIVLAQRTVMEWPIDFELRYTLANCLDMTENRESHLEALKQRILGCNMELFQTKRREGVQLEKYNHIISNHFGRLETIKAFLEGDLEYPSNRIGKMLCLRRDADDDILSVLQRLEQIGDVANLPYPATKTPTLICVLDTNAISNRDASINFMNSLIRFLAPPEVLLELADWYKLQRIPWEFEAVEIQEVTRAIPHEIDSMFSKRKGKPPSLADKKVATLALELKANAIVSNDRDLWDSDMTYQIEKNFGHRIEVILPVNFTRWLEKRGLLSG